MHVMSGLQQQQQHYHIRFYFYAKNFYDGCKYVKDDILLTTSYIISASQQSEKILLQNSY